jgi:hypothetical protein
LVFSAFYHSAGFESGGGPSGNGPVHEPADNFGIPSFRVPAQKGLAEDRRALEGLIANSLKI